MVSVSRDGLSPSASPVSSGGASAAPPYAPSPTARPAVIRSAARVHSLRRAISSALSFVVTSNAAKCSLSCTAVAIPAWCAPWKGTAAPLSDAGSVSPPERTAATAPPAATAPSASPAPPQPSRARREGAVAPAGSPPSVPVSLMIAFPYFVTAAASLDSGSASALTASESSLRSALPTLSYEVKS